MIKFDHFPDITFSKPIGELKINESLTIQIYGKMPNRFHRWMAKLLLGWIYTDVVTERKDDDNNGTD